MTLTSLVYARTSINRGGDQCPCFEDNFTCDNWTSTGCLFGPCGGVMKWEAISSNTGKSFFDLSGDIPGCTLSDTAWTLRFSMNVTTVTQSGTTFQRGYLGIKSNTCCSASTTDFLGLAGCIRSSANCWDAIGADGVSLNTAHCAGSVFCRNPQVEQLYVGMTRSCTTLTVSLYSDACFSCLLEAQTECAPAGITGLRYLWFSGRSDGTDCSGSIKADIDCLKLWCGIVL